MTTSPGWRSVVASAAAAAALFAAPLAGAATAHADSRPHTPQQTHAPHHGQESDEQNSDEQGWDKKGWDKEGSDDHDCEQSCGHDERRPGKPQLARTGSDHTQEVVLGGAAAALIAAGAGTMLMTRRRSNV